MINRIRKDLSLLRTYGHDILVGATALMAAAILILGVLNFTHSQANNSAQLAQIKSISQQIKNLAQQNLSESTAASKQNAQQLQTLSQELQCIGDFFAQPNRTNLTISNLNNCTVASVPGGSAGSNKSGVNNGQASPQAPTETRAGAQSSPNNNGGQTQGNGGGSGKVPLVCTLTLHLLGCKQ